MDDKNKIKEVMGILGRMTSEKKKVSSRRNGQRFGGRPKGGKNGNKTFSIGTGALDHVVGDSGGGVGDEQPRREIDGPLSPVFPRGTVRGD